MPTINVFTNWNIKEICENQKISGNLHSNAVYKFTLKNGKTITASIKTVVEIFDKDPGTVVDYKLIPNIVFTANGYIVNSTTTFLVSEVVDYSRVYVKYASLKRENSPKSVSDDPFVFHFINNVGRRFKISVDRDQFVGIPAMNKNGQVITHFGFIDHTETNDENRLNIIMKSLISNRGVFRVGTTVIPNDSIRGVYNYGIEFEPYVYKKAKEEKAEAEDIQPTYVAE